MKDIQLQAHKGVASECPENTMSAFRAAVLQGYDVIELDLRYTQDKKIVVLHDETINRTARKPDGAPIGRDIYINEITYAEALEYDFGISTAKKFAGEKIPLLGDTLELAAKNKIRLKIDNKLQSFPSEILNIFFEQIKPFAEYVSITSNDIEFVRLCLAASNGVSIDYDGYVTEEALTQLSEIVPDGRLTVWLPYKCKSTEWVQIPFADKKLAELVKRYARLGIWLISGYEDFYAAVNELAPYIDIIETDGTVKPHRREGFLYDMHTHSKSSHDSDCEVSDMARAAEEQGLAGFAVTDHCDCKYHATVDLREVIRSSAAAAKAADAASPLTVLCGVEIGEAHCCPELAAELLSETELDVVIGSLHMLSLEGCEQPYSKIDFSKMSEGEIEKYLEQYFDELLQMLKTSDIDILAHLTCPLRYINGKYGRQIDCGRYDKKIEEILEYIITHKIALEVNSSCMHGSGGYNVPMPEEYILSRYRAMGGYLLTLGSDAHTAESSANAFDELSAMLVRLGFENIFCYKGRCAIQCTLSGLNFKGKGL